MGIRETLNEKPAITTIATAVIIVIAVVIIAFQLIGTGQPTVKSFYTVDDGKTTFVDDQSKFPPFDHDGHPAVRAMVFSCDGGKTQFVAWLERYTPQAKRKLEEARKSSANADSTVNYYEIQAAGTQVKPPGAPDSEWTTQSNAEKFNAIMTAKCPDGKSDLPTQVSP